MAKSNAERQKEYRARQKERAGKWKTIFDFEVFGFRLTLRRIQKEGVNI
jgi:hypothetical protein